MNVAYFVNQYPAPSHTFIRREIHALEAHGIRVGRYSLRCGDGLVDPDDLAEVARTRQVLAVGAARLAWGVVRAALTRPAAFARAVRATVQLGFRSNRGLLRHAVYLAEACTLVQWLEEAKVEHLHAHFGTNSTAVALLCRKLGGPTYSFTVHGPEEFDMPEGLKLGMKIGTPRSWWRFRTSAGASSTDGAAWRSGRRSTWCGARWTAGSWGRRERRRPPHLACSTSDASASRRGSSCSSRRSPGWRGPTLPSS